MSSWKECKLGDVAFFQRGHDLPKSQMNDGLIPVAGSNGVIGFHDKSTTKAPGITIGRSGNIGTPKFYNQDFWAHNTVLYVKDFKGNDEKFVFYFLNTIDLSGFNSGSAVPTLNRNHIHEIDVKIPPLEEQKAIAEVLSSLDDKIDLLHRQNQTLESLAQTLFRQWFIEEAKEEWEEKTLSYFGDIICGKTPSKSNSQYFDGNVPFIKIPDMHGNTFIFKTTDTLSEIGKESQKNKTLPPKSICVSCIATVGLVSMNIIESQTNQQINSIIPNKDIYRYFIYLFMQSSYDLLHAMASGGTATLNLNTGDFSKMEILKPDDETLKIFHQVIEPTFDKIFINSKQIQTLENLRDTLLPKLLSGEVRVKI
ncbi:restriction endonuclease subunit S [Aliarcobacter butzleri]|uniref:restriction endonuclease subunit S n=1 Tax=Aliarcobacter butzleri TaxID=28197 RepID=UPI0021B2D797|nr:restriction endonuclease subunit S [Aliarcobacter butzleri]MCT7562174.1 restriction endonuclease subunit S [Aliarcobacter butzleri]